MSGTLYSPSSIIIHYDRVVIRSPTPQPLHNAECSLLKQIENHCAPISEQFILKVLANGPVSVFCIP